MKIALLGAAGTGKTELRLALEQCLQSANIEVLDLTHASQLRHLESYDVTLLCGLDLPEPPRPGTPPYPSRQERELIDQLIRQQLDQASISYQVVYGLGSARLDNALYAIARQTPNLAIHSSRPEVLSRWTGPCERCADAQCEHRLFTDLLKQKSF